MWQRYSIVALTAAALAVGGFTLPARAEGGKRHGRLDALAGKLGLSEQQKQNVRKIRTDYRKESAPVKKQLHVLRREQREEMGKVLTEEQRGKFHGLIKEMWQKKWEATAAKLDLSAEQKDRVEQVREAYGKKFRELAAQKTEKKPHEFRKLRRQKHKAIAALLTKDQRVKLHSIVRAEKRARHNPKVQSAFRKTMVEKLGVTAAQKEQFARIRADFSTKREKSVAQLKKLRTEKQAAMKKVLTEEQLAKLREMRKG